MIANRDTYISITRTFDAPPDAVFAAWTTPTHFGRWFGTESTKVEDVSMDVRVGGDWKARMILPDGNEIGWHGSYQEVDAPSRLVMTLSDRPGDQFELVTVELRSVGGGTEMTLPSRVATCRRKTTPKQKKDGGRFFDDLATGLARSIRTPIDGDHILPGSCRWGAVLLPGGAIQPTGSKLIGVRALI